MTRRGVLGRLTAAFGAVAVIRPATAASESRGSRHGLALHVDRDDPAVMKPALGNAFNAGTYYPARGEAIAIEIVVYGPGLTMLREDTSPMKERLASLRKSLPQITLSACHNTIKAMEKAEGKAIVLVPGARVVPAGVVRLMELQEQGWSYIKP